MCVYLQACVSVGVIHDVLFRELSSLEELLQTSPKPKGDFENGKIAP